MDLKLIYIKTDRNSVFGFSIASFVSCCGFIQILMSVFLIIEAYIYEISDLMKKFALFAAAIGFVDGLTSIFSAYLGFDYLASAACLGYIVDLLVIATYYLTWIFTKQPITFVGSVPIIISILVCVFAAPAAATLSQLLMLGATGYEMMSPSEFINSKVAQEPNQYYPNEYTLPERSEIEEGNDVSQNIELDFI